MFVGALALHSGCVGTAPVEHSHDTISGLRTDVLSITYFPLIDDGRFSLRVTISPLQQVTYPQPHQLAVYYAGQLERTISHVDELEDYCQIDSADAAAGFVRLLTDDRARDAGLAEWEGWEVDEKGRVAGLGRSLPPKVLDKVHLTGRLVKSVRGGWIIHRIILEAVPVGAPDVLCAIDERVSSSGEYQKLARAPLYSGTIDVGQRCERL